MSINVLALGKTRQDYLIQGISEFQKRLSRYTTIKLIELPDLKISLESQELTREKEAEILLKYIKSTDYLIALDEKGNSLSSIEFAQHLENILRRDIVFCIGGIHGLSGQVLQRADYKLSFSSFTFTHQMIRLLLFEQLYRAFNILKGGQYHK